MENAILINFEITMQRNVREQKIRERGVNHENHKNLEQYGMRCVAGLAFLHPITQPSKFQVA